MDASKTPFVTPSATVFVAAAANESSALQTIETAAGTSDPTAKSVANESRPTVGSPVASMSRYESS